MSMKLYIKSKVKNIDAMGEYDPKTGEFVVLKGSILSDSVVSTGSFRGTKSILKAREGCVKENVLLVDKTFTSSSTAANFVRGASSNGLICWKDENGKTLKEILNEGSNNE